jgi:hypothetical protein
MKKRALFLVLLIVTVWMLSCTNERIGKQNTTGPSPQSAEKQITINPSLDSDSISRNPEVAEISAQRKNEWSSIDHIFKYAAYMKAQRKNSKDSKMTDTIGIIPSIGAEGSGKLIPIVDLSLTNDITFVNLSSGDINNIFKPIRGNFPCVILGLGHDTVVMVAPNLNLARSNKVIYPDGTVKEMRFDKLEAAKASDPDLNFFIAVMCYQDFYSFWETVDSQKIASDKQKLFNGMSGAEKLISLYIPLGEQKNLRDCIEHIAEGRGTLEVTLEKYRTKLVFTVPSFGKKEFTLLSLFNFPSRKECEHQSRK